MVAAGLEVNINGGSFRAAGTAPERLHFGVRTAEAMVISLSDDFATAHNYATHHWIRLDPPASARRQLQGAPHEGRIVGFSRIHNRLRRDVAAGRRTHYVAQVYNLCLPPVENRCHKCFEIAFNHPRHPR